MKTIFHPATERGYADHGWLKTYHSFSFSSYFDPKKVHFGALRVLNDDSVAPGMGFGKHPHDNMEIISIPLEGDLKHGDSMGNEGIIKKGEVQVMSAGSGVVHSEFNPNKDQFSKFLQIWVFPRERNVQSRYDQINIEEGKVINDFQQILSPDPEDTGVWIHQDAWFFMADFKTGHQQEYKIKKSGNSVYVFVLRGQIRIEDQKLSDRDGMGLWETEQFQIEALADSEFLLMEVPMELPEFVH